VLSKLNLFTSPTLQHRDRWRRVGGGGIYNAGGIQNRQAYVTHDFMREQSGLRKKKKKRGELVDLDPMANICCLKRKLEK
jgi:hypothetical protein